MNERRGWAWAWTHMFLCGQSLFACATQRWVRGWVDGCCAILQPAVRMDKHEELVVRLHAEIRALQLENRELKKMAAQTRQAAASPVDEQRQQLARQQQQQASTAALLASEANPFLSSQSDVATGQAGDKQPPFYDGGRAAGGGLTNMGATGNGDDSAATAAAAAAAEKSDIMQDDFGMVRRQLLLATLPAPARACLLYTSPSPRDRG